MPLEGRGTIFPLELELQADLSCPSLLGSELGSSARAVLLVTEPAPAPGGTFFSLNTSCQIPEVFTWAGFGVLVVLISWNGAALFAGRVLVEFAFFGRICHLSWVSVAVMNAITESNREGRPCYSYISDFERSQDRSSRQEGE